MSVADLLYVDTSALLDRVLGQKRHVEIAAAMFKQARAGGRLVSSRLLHLEARRIEVREAQAGRSLPALGMLVRQVNALPLTDDVWQAAYDIELHLKTLDALHLATCRLVDGELLASDAGLVKAARALKIPVHPAAGQL